MGGGGNKGIGVYVCTDLPVGEGPRVATHGSQLVLEGPDVESVEEEKVCLGGGRKSRWLDVIVVRTQKKNKLGKLTELWTYGVSL